jgi:hypothetical protein
MNAITEQELAFAADVRRRDAIIAKECKARGFTSKRGWTSYPSDTVFSVAKPTNDERSRAEIIKFRANPPTGSYCAYLSVDKRTITTFMGGKLADVLTIKNNPVRNSPYTNERGSFWARCIDGRLYYGRHNGAGMYCLMRPSKKFLVSATA